MTVAVRADERAAAAIDRFWAVPEPALFAALGTGPKGLSVSEAARRLAQYGANRIDEDRRASAAALLGRQFANPLVVILIFGASVSAVLREWIDAGIILAIVIGSALLGFWQEYRASNAIAALRARLALQTTVRREDARVQVPVTAIVPGDIVCLAAGNLVPADGRVLVARDFLVTEATLTGESLPVEKHAGALAPDTPLAARSNCVFMGSAVRSGTAEVLIVQTGGATAFGAIAGRLRRAEPVTEFAHGIARFGAMLIRAMLLIVVAVLTANQLLGRPFTESLLFAVALAVGLSPELLPAIISVTLSAGARHLAKGGVIVRRLDAIENLGSMDILCTDKTGTLTAGAVSLADAIDPQGRASRLVREAGYLNGWFETGIANPLDAALVAAAKAEHWTPGIAIKRDEIPYDFSRRQLSIVVEQEGRCRLITKGAYLDVAAVCSHVRSDIGDVALDAVERDRLDALFKAQGEAGRRALAVAERTVDPQRSWAAGDERGLVLTGFLLFADPPKPDAARTIADLAAAGVAIKLISGDNRYVTRHVAAVVGLDTSTMLTGSDLAAISDAALGHRAPRTALFAEIDPQQKERIVRALQRAGHVVGFLGDGINDAPALHTADVGLSVDQAVDVARDSADIVLLKRDLDVLRQGVVDGRRTFINTMKYIMIAISSTFGNMVSMAVATPLLPFLPLLPKQILLNNFLSDVAAIAISTDRVDPERLAAPLRWDVKEVRRFMLAFGLLSSCFDFATFAVLLLVFAAGEETFQTIWFVVSLLTEVLVMLVLRTRRAAIASRPSRGLAWSIAIIALLAMGLPFAPPIAEGFGFAQLSARMLIVGGAIVACYVVATELAKRRYYRADKRSGRLRTSPHSGKRAKAQ